MPDLREIASAIRQRYPEDADVVEMEQVAAEICRSARDMLDAITVATREQDIYLSMVASLSDRDDDDEPLDDEQIQSAGDAAVSQGEIAEIAERQSEAFVRELVLKILRNADV